MIKNILVSVFALFFAFAIPSSALANPGIQIVETDFQQISISYANSILRVTGAEGEVLQIYNVAGVRVMNVTVEGEDKRFVLSLPKGCYTVKVGKSVRKSYVK